MAKQAKRERKKREILDYYTNNTHVFDTMTTLEVIRRIEAEIPGSDGKGPASGGRRLCHVVQGAPAGDSGLANPMERRSNLNDWHRYQTVAYLHGH